MIQTSLLKRIATAIVLILALVPSLFFLPTVIWNIACAVFAAICAYEWSRLCGLKGLALSTSIFLTVAVVAAALMDVIPAKWLFVASALTWIAAVPAIIWNNSQNIAKATRIGLGGLVIASAASALAALRLSDPALLFVLMAIVWVSDTAAYFSGRKWGRRKLAPSISPGKTWEGVAGGLTAVGIYALALIVSLPAALPQTASRVSENGNALFMIVCLALAVAGIVGDLAESWAKRLAGVKDSGTILPGHGGILDRVDALLPVLPMAALIFSR